MQAESAGCIKQEKELGQISAAARCEELIGKEIGMFVDRSALLMDIDLDKMTPEILDKLADHLIAKALKEFDREPLGSASIGQACAWRKSGVDELERVQPRSRDSVRQYVW
ncbi:MAG: hypothetical protein ABSE86_31625 [Bryobacteraceae bacterium]